MKTPYWLSVLFLASACQPAPPTEQSESELVALSATAVPPPLGPVATVEKPDSPSVGIGVLRSLVRGFAQQSVDRVNAALAAQHKPGHVSIGDVSAWSPYRAATELQNQPNQYFVKAPFGITINVEIPVVADRTIYLPIDIDVTCDGWYRNAGKLKYIATPGPASFEGGSIIEDILHISDLINSEIRNNFTAPGSTQLPLAASACNTIGTSNPGDGVDWDSIIWSAPPVLRFLPTSQVEVTPLALKRLPARMLNGTPIGTAVENVSLETYANFHIEQTGQMSLRENDQVALNLPAMVLRGEPTTSLVVIGNVRDEVLRPNDSAFSVSDQSANYSPGTYTMQLTTNYWMPPTPPLKKPTMITVPTYELTYNVKYTPSQIVKLPIGAL